jgi:hypothetical protein
MPLGENGWHLQIEGAVLYGGFGGAIGFYKGPAMPHALPCPAAASEMGPAFMGCQTPGVP